MAWAHFEAHKYVIRSAKVSAAGQVSSMTVEAARNDQHGRILPPDDLVTDPHPSLAAMGKGEINRKLAAAGPARARARDQAILDKEALGD